MLPTALWQVVLCATMFARANQTLHWCCLLLPKAPQAHNSSQPQRRLINTYLVRVEADEPVQVFAGERVHASTHARSVDLPYGVTCHWQRPIKLGEAPAGGLLHKQQTCSSHAVCLSRALLVSLATGSSPSNLARALQRQLCVHNCSSRAFDLSAWVCCVPWLGKYEAD